MDNNQNFTSVQGVHNATEKTAKSVVGMSLAIAGLVLSWMGLCGGFPGFLSIAMSIIGLLLSKKQPFKKVSVICVIIGIVISAVCIIIGFVLIGSLVSYLS